jgi:beta-glucosidase
VRFAEGCLVEGQDTSGFAEAVAVAADAEVAVVVVGDQAGLFGRGTVGEGNDTESLDLPGVQRQLVEAVLATGTPVVLVLLTGRPYAIGWALDGSGDLPGAVIQSFFPGEEGGAAIVDVIAGRVNPSGRLPVSLPRSAGAQPYGYLHPTLGGDSDVTAAESTPVRPFGFGLSYTSFAHSDLVVDEEVASGAPFSVSVTVENTGTVPGVDVVQVYGHDVVGSIVRPLEQLLGYARVELQPGERTRVEFTIPSTRLSFRDSSMVKIVEPGTVEVWVAAHAGASEPTLGDAGTGGAIVSDAARTERWVGRGATRRAPLLITGERYEVTRSDPRTVTVTSERLGAPRGPRLLTGADA